MSDKAFLDFITQEGNLEVALDVSKKLDEFKTDMHKRFWNLFNEAMNNKLKQSDYVNDWKFQGHPAKGPKKGWATTYFLPKRVESNDFLKLGMGQATDFNDFQLYWGVRWNESQKENLDQSILIKLRSYVSGKGMNKSNVRWIGWNELDYQIYSPNFLRNLYLDQKTLIDELADLYWEFFIEIKPLISEANRLLSEPS